MKRKYALIFLFLALSLMIVIPVSAKRNRPRVATVPTVKDRIITIETNATDGATHGYGNVDRGGIHSWSEDTWFDDAAHAHTGYYLAYWEYDGAILPNTTDIRVFVTQGSHTLVAVFSPLPTPSPLPPPPPEPMNYTLVISAFSCDGSPLPSGCVTNPAVGTFLYEAGQIAIVTAAASEGWFFSHWLLDDVNRTENPTSVEMASNHTLVAVFNPIPVPPPPPPPPPPTESRNLTVFVALCGDTMGYWKVALSYFDEAPTSVTIKISTTAYAEILKFFGTAAFTAPYRSTVYSKVYYTRTQYYMEDHALAIGVAGVPSIQVTLVP